MHLIGHKHYVPMYTLMFYSEIASRIYVMIHCCHISKSTGNLFVLCGSANNISVVVYTEDNECILISVR